MNIFLYIYIYQNISFIKSLSMKAVKKEDLIITQAEQITDFRFLQGASALLSLPSCT